jgi:hypothetical protein
MAKKKRKAAKPKTAKPGGVNLYTLEVELLDGRMRPEFIEKNPDISRTIQMRGDQTLEDLHDVIFDAFDREEEHLYEFQFGKGRKDPNAATYTAPVPFGMDFGDPTVTGLTDEVTIDELKLKVRQTFRYWFDFGDDWMHKIKVKAIDDEVPSDEFPKIIGRVGESPPQYPYYEDEEEYDDEEDEEEDE